MSPAFIHNQEAYTLFVKADRRGSPSTAAKMKKTVFYVTFVLGSLAVAQAAIKQVWLLDSSSQLGQSQGSAMLSPNHVALAVCSVGIYTYFYPGAASVDPTSFLTKPFLGPNTCSANACRRASTTAVEPSS